MQFAIGSKYNLSANHTNQFILREVIKGGTIRAKRGLLSSLCYLTTRAYGNFSKNN